MNHTGDHRNASQAPRAKISSSCPAIVGPGRDHVATSTIAHRVEARTEARPEAGASTLVADLNQWLVQHGVHLDVLEAFMDEVLIALIFQEIVGTHPARIDSPLGALARQDLARIVVTAIARQRQR